MPTRPSIPPQSVALPVALHTAGANFDIEVRPDGISKVRVWRRPDLSRDEGAQCAVQLAAEMQQLAIGARACIFNLSRAAPTWGPVTHQALRRMLEPWEAAGKLIFIITPDEAITRILWRELQRECAPSWGKLVSSEDIALKVLLGKK